MVAQHVKKSFHIEVNTNMNFNDFSILATLGKGSFGRVFLVSHKKSE